MTVTLRNAVTHAVSHGTPSYPTRPDPSRPTKETPSAAVDLVDKSTIKIKSPSVTRAPRSLNLIRGER